MKKKQKWTRILKLADFVEKIPPKKFDFRTYVGHDWRGAKDLSCGTTACALGWATAMPLFRKLGLRLVKTKDIAERIKLGKGHPESKSEELFGISGSTYYMLFIPSDWSEGCLSHGATPKEWAKHARSIVKQLQAGKIE